MSRENMDLLKEAFRISYRLRSTFFYRKLSEYGTKEFPETIKRLVPLSKDYEWTKFKEWGISDKALSQIKKSSLSLIQVFAHPRLIREHSHLTAYYRNVAVLSQKSVAYLIKINVGKFENDLQKEMNEKEALLLACLFNEHISLIIESSIKGFDNEDVNGLLFASTGAQIDGSWRNAVGDEAEKVVQKMLIKEAIDKGQLTAFLLRDNSRGLEKFDKQKIDEQMQRIGEIKGFTLKTKKSVIFSSEPDISIVAEDGSTLAVIEVKGGTDPAGALERYGASKKSFEEAIKNNKMVETILLASCLTSEVEKRIKEDNTIKKYYNLTSIITDEKNKIVFLAYLFRNFLK